MIENNNNTAPHNDNTQTYLEEISKLNNELVNMQRELNASNAALAKAIELKNRFVGMVVHDLRNPLTIISMYAQTIKSRINEPKLVEECIDVIEYSANFMAELIENLLDTTSLASGSFSITLNKNNITELMNIIIKKVLPIAQNRAITIHKDITAVEPFYFDAFRIEQAINNIISNALKYTPKDGSVCISLTDNESLVFITITDNGLGIPEEERHKIFSFFGRTSNRSPHGDKSVGIGLALCKSIIDAHEGTIEISSKPGEGTTVMITLPKMPKKSLKHKT